MDTNILLRLVQPDSSEYETIRQCTDRLWARGSELFYTSQNLAEFWNVCTRPADRNGFGFSVAETDERAALIEAKFSFAADSKATHQEWRKIVVAANVSGSQVHDARSGFTLQYFADFVADHLGLRAAACADALFRRAGDHLLHAKQDWRGGFGGQDAWVFSCFSQTKAARRARSRRSLLCC